MYLVSSQKCPHLTAVYGTIAPNQRWYGMVNFMIWDLYDIADLK
jgi:hypothetical protein